MLTGLHIQLSNSLIFKRLLVFINTGRDDSAFSTVTFLLRSDSMLMTDKNQPVEALLEHYVFMVATQYIDQVDTELQAKLIKLVLDVGKEPRQDDHASPEVTLRSK
ncbi:hypothetical protein GCM10027592_16110 [Spirosoma flavus]